MISMFSIIADAAQAAMYGPPTPEARPVHEEVPSALARPISLMRSTHLTCRNGHTAQEYSMRGTPCHCGHLYNRICGIMEGYDTDGTDGSGFFIESDSEDEEDDVVVVDSPHRPPPIEIPPVSPISQCSGTPTSWGSPVSTHSAFV